MDASVICDYATDPVQMHERSPLLETGVGLGDRQKL